MQKSRYGARSALAGLGVLACSGLAQAAPEGELSAARAMEVVNIKGSELSALQGQAVIPATAGIQGLNNIGQ